VEANVFFYSLSSSSSLDKHSSRERGGSLANSSCGGPPLKSVPPRPPAYAARAPNIPGELGLLSRGLFRGSQGLLSGSILNGSRGLLSGGLFVESWGLVSGGLFEGSQGLLCEGSWWTLSGGSRKRLFGVLSSGSRKRLSGILSPCSPRLCVAACRASHRPFSAAS
jgi:hypothetical protein